MDSAVGSLVGFLVLDDVGDSVINSSTVVGREVSAVG